MSTGIGGTIPSADRDVDALHEVVAHTEVVSGLFRRLDSADRVCGSAGQLVVSSATNARSRSRGFGVAIAASTSSSRSLFSTGGTIGPR